MNCSESGRLQRLLSGLLQELRGGGPASSTGSSTLALAPRPPGSAAAGPSSSSSRARGEDDAYLYILLIMIFYGCLAGGLILAYTRSRKLESKHDPYHLYIESDWTAPPSAHGGSPDGERP
ncbi:potassium voltage-gated channel subfamily E regulatory beta subunit 5 [Heteronotia binoei]|uniref:potassium voltage-gated channel subfamily E regulatory beta subunit 5 n=1 Tax=Heteronotia binoei TaxID=13085 RepID=UPI0029300012|nr:potassium voltage-gated channel subfamily E regulatory beta subunit 5 [Heteronotia binoei]